MANKIFQAFIDTAKTIAGYPITVANAVFMRDGSTLDEFSENIPHREDDEDTDIEVPNIDADMLDGHPADYYAKQNDLNAVVNKIGNTDVSKWGNTYTQAIKSACDGVDGLNQDLADKMLYKDYGELNANGDANNYTESGILKLNSYDFSNKNFPNNYGVLVVDSKNGYVSQTFNSTTEKIYKRFKDGNWTDWKELTDSYPIYLDGREIQAGIEAFLDFSSITKRCTLLIDYGWANGTQAYMGGTIVLFHRGGQPKQVPMYINGNLHLIIIHTHDNGNLYVNNTSTETIRVNVWRLN